MDIRETVALVTGANRGIGKAIVEELLERGAKRVYATARNAASLEPIVARDRNRVIALQLDVTNAAEVRAAAERAQDVTLLVNNAGVVQQYGAPLLDESWVDAGRAEMEVNVFGSFAVTQAFAPVLAKNGGGSIVYLNSVASLVGFPALASYSMSKAALHSLTQLSRTMLHSQSTRVTGVYPGPVDTEMSARIQMQKTSPEAVAKVIVDGLEEGLEEIFPDPMSQAMGQTFLQNPKELERQIAQMAR